MPITEKRKESMYKYAKENLKRVPLDMQKSTYEEIKLHAEARSESVNGFIKRAISETIERDSSADSQQASPQAQETPQAGALVLVGRGPVSVGRGDMRTLYIAQGTEREYYVDPVLSDDEWDTLQKAKDTGTDNPDEFPF